MRRKLMYVLLFLALAAAGVYMGLVKPQADMLRAVRKAEIAAVDLTAVPDGAHRGEFTYASFTYVVEVEVREHRITGIRVLQNRDSDYARKAEVVVERVLQAQSLQVDAVSGATTTSKALLKAMENALR